MKKETAKILKWSGIAWICLWIVICFSMLLSGDFEFFGAIAGLGVFSFPGIIILIIGLVKLRKENGTRK